MMLMVRVMTLVMKMVMYFVMTQEFGDENTKHIITL